MIINGQSVNGVFKYNPNVTYEKGDLVISNNGLLYYPEASCQGIDPDTDTNGYFTPYSFKQSAKSIEELTVGNDRLLVPANILAQYLMNLVIGLTMEGSIDTISYNSSEIMLMVDNQIHLLTQVTDQLEISDESGNIEAFEFTNANLLLRVYKSTPNNETISIQELIDYTNGSFFYRYATITSSTITPEWSTWKFIGTSVGNSGNYPAVNALQTQFESYRQLVNNVISNIEQLNKNIENFYSFYEVTNDNASWLGVILTSDTTATFTTNYLSSGSICILFVEYQSGGITYKESMYISLSTNGTLQSDNFEVTISGNTIKTLVLESSTVDSIKIEKLIVSKRANMTRIIS